MHFTGTNFVQMLEALPKVNNETLVKLVKKGDIDPEVFSLLKYEAISYAYGFTPKQIEEMDENMFQWYAAFAFDRIKKEVKI